MQIWSSPALNERLQDASRSSAGGWRTQATRNVLVIVEVAVALVLVIGAGLLWRSFLALQSQGSGFNAENILTVSVRMPTESLRGQMQNLSREERAKLWRAASISFRDRLLQEFVALPGVVAVTQATRQPISSYYHLSEWTVEGGESVAEAETPRAVVTWVDHNYFGVMGLPLQSGRHFGIEDRPDGRRVAIISGETARSFWPGQDPIGKRFKWRNDNSADPWYTVIGRCGDIREDGLHKPPKPYIYMSLVQFPTGGGYYFLKTNGDPYAQMRAVELVARRADPKTILYRPRTLKDLVRDSTWQLNYSMVLLAGLAWLALFLALIGVYGVLSYSVRERTREIGVRMALGADRAAVIKLVLRQALGLAGLGILIGTLLAAGLTRLLRSLLYGIAPLDLPTFAIAALAMATVAVAAGYLPALRATRIQAMQALRYG